MPAMTVPKMVIKRGDPTVSPFLEDAVISVADQLPFEPDVPDTEKTYVETLVSSKLSRTFQKNFWNANTSYREEGLNLPWKFKTKSFPSPSAGFTTVRIWKVINDNLPDEIETD